MPTTRALLAEAEARLAAAGVSSPRADAELLLAHVLGCPRARLALTGPAGPDQVARYRDLVAERARRTPLQHLTGTAPFRHLELRVGPGVFIPRPETELLVDAAETHLAAHPRPAGAAPPHGHGPLLVDLCTGSGALALSLATEVPRSRVVAVELSAEALAWARANLAGHRAELADAGSDVALVHADATAAARLGGALEDLRGDVDVVVSNPPYVPDAAIPREPEVRDHDPGQALFGGPDGLALIGPLAGQAALLLRPGGLLLLEHADAQGEDAGTRGVPALLRGMSDPDGAPIWRDVGDHPDLAGLPRYTSAVRAAGRMAP